MQTIIDPESPFDFKQIPNACGDRCESYAYRTGFHHRHCAATMGSALCNAMVRIVGDGPNNAWMIEEEDGCICADCKEVTCKQCTHDSIDGTRKLCSDCSLIERNQLEDSVRMDMALIDAERALTLYLECLRSESNAAKIRASVLTLNRLEDLFSLINREMVPNLERAAGVQQRLPAIEAAA